MESKSARRRARVAIAVLAAMLAIGVASGCGGRAAAAERILQRVGVAMSREHLPTVTTQRTEDLLNDAGQSLGSEDRIRRSIDLACKANGNVKGYTGLGKFAVTASTEDEDVKETAGELFDAIKFDSKLAAALCSAR